MPAGPRNRGRQGVIGRGVITVWVIAVGVGESAGADCSPERERAEADTDRGTVADPRLGGGRRGKGYRACYRNGGGEAASTQQSQNCCTHRRCPSRRHRNNDARDMEVVPESALTV